MNFILLFFISEPLASLGATVSAIFHDFSHCQATTVDFAM